MKFIIINGPNLNLLGKRETTIYGDTDFKDYFTKLKAQFPSITIDYYQSNIEGELIDKLQKVGFTYDGIILNAGGYTHTSVAIADTIKAISSPCVETHISNIDAREDFRRTSIIGPVCLGSISGFGLFSYQMALEALINYTKQLK